MSKKFGLPAVGVTMLVAVSGYSAADHAVHGEYKTQAAADSLFVDGGRVLSADLFFSVPGMETVLAPKGSEIMQSVPAVVWRFSALLPVSDYLRTAVIHSAGSDEKIRLWQDVQKTFYNGLLAEGASEMDAKIAFAGAYGFSPRWPLVEFTRIEERVPVYPNTELYSVAYIQPAEKRMTLDDYRKLSLEIFQQPEEFTLEDIKVAIDAADSYSERVVLNGVEIVNPASNVKVTSENVAPNELTEAVEVSTPRVVIELTQEPAHAPGAGVITGDNGTLLQSDNKSVVKSGGDALPSESEKDAETVPVLPAAPVLNQLKLSTVPAKFVTASSGFVDDEVLSADSLQTSSSEGVPVSLDALDESEDEWVTLPDGTLILRSTTKLASE